VALTLRLLGGLSVDEVARSFLVSESTMAKRLVRTKYKIKAAGIPYRVPDERCGGLLAVSDVAFAPEPTSSELSAACR
jgi:RNA polymerase sigma-70 factor (ECF subfamily)